MNDTQLTWLALALSVIGLVGVYVVTYIDQPTQIRISEAENYIEKNVLIVGQITDKFVTDDGHVFILIEDDTGKLTGIAFNKVAESLPYGSLDKNRFLQIYGTIELYKGQLEIVVQRINPI